MAVCKNPACGVEIQPGTCGLPKVWCSQRCKSSARALVRKQARHHRGLLPHGGRHRDKITDEAIARAKVLFPSCAGDITAEMVGEPAAWERFTTILPRKLVRMQRAG